MKTLKESLLDDEETLVNDESLMDVWMDKYSNRYSTWYVRDTPAEKRNWKKLKDGYKTNAWLSIELGTENEIPNYINFDGPENLYIRTDAKVLNINSMYLKNIKKIEIVGKNLTTIHITGEVSTENMILNCDLKLLDTSKCQTDHLFLWRSKNLDIFKSRLPKYNVIHITQEVKDVIYDYVKKQTGIDLFQAIVG